MVRREAITGLGRPTHYDPIPGLDLWNSRGVGDHNFGFILQHDNIVRRLALEDDVAQGAAPGASAMGY